MTVRQDQGMSATEPAVRLRCYGGLRMWRSGVEVDVGAPRLRTLLAALLAARGGTVGVDSLVELIWGAAPSPSAVNQLHRLVGQARRLFEPDLASRATGSWVFPAGQGYRLVTDAQSCDLMAVRALLDTPGAVPAVLEIVQEPAFAGLDAEVLGHPAFVALEQERIQIAVDAAELALGDPGALRLLAPLQRIAASAPLHEPLQARMIRLLTSAGRRAEALVLFDATRRLLAEDLGADPGAELRGAHLAALSDGEPGTPPAHRPAQLPRRVAGFVDRGDLTDHSAGIVVLSGMGGIGKTALAVEWAHRLAPSHPDGQLHLNLRGFDPSGRVVKTIDALAMLLESVGVGPAELPGDVDARAARFRSAVADRRMIILLDNARDSEQVRPLLPGAPGCLVLVTSRNRLAGLVAHEGARAVQVGRLDEAGARELLAKRIGAPRLAAEPAATTELIRFCAGLPLALSITAAHAAVRPGRRLADLVEELASQARLDALTTGEPHDDVRSALSWSYLALSPAAARLFRLISVHSGPEIPVEAAASITGTSGAAVRTALAELSAANMITEAGRQRYTLHDLLRAYAGELLGDERADAVARLVEHCLRDARNAYLTFGRPEIAPLGPPSPGMTSTPIADLGDALRWYTREQAALTCIIDLALLHGHHREAVLTVLYLRAVRSARAEPYSDSREQTMRVLAVVGDLGEPVLEAALLREAALVESPTDPAVSRLLLRRALDIAERADDVIGQAHVLRNLGLTIAGEDRDRALPLLRRSVRAARRTGEPTVLVYCIDALARTLQEDGQLDESVALAREAFDIALATGLDDLRSNAATRLAETALLTGDHRQAAAMARWAAEHIPPGEIHIRLPVYAFLAEASDRLGDDDQARAACAVFRDLMRRHGPAYRQALGDEEVNRFIATVDRITSASEMH
jgi:DNA-binding SARP family transcriptional activator/tetratricopeptide (TPR) repeat protein